MEFPQDRSVITDEDFMGPARELERLLGHPDATLRLLTPPTGRDEAWSPLVQDDHPLPPLVNTKEGVKTELFYP